MGTAVTEVVAFDTALDRTQLHGFALGRVGGLGAAGFEFTVEAWVRIGAGAGGARLPVVGSVRSAAKDGGVGLFLGIRGRRVHIESTTVGGTSGDRQLREERWYHLAWRYAQGVQTVFVNGVVDAFNRAPLVLEERAPKLLLGLAIRTGRSGHEPDDIFAGRIAELRIWDRGIDEQRLRERWTRRLDGGEPGLIGYWPLDDVGSGPVDRVSGKPAEGVGGPSSTDDTELPLFRPEVFEGVRFGETVPSALVAPGARHAVPPSTPFALEAWIRPSRVEGAPWTGPIVSQHAQLMGWELRAGERAGMMLAIDNKPVDLDSKIALRANVWQHLLGVYDGASLSLYVNGLLDVTMSVSGTPTPFNGPVSIAFNPHFADRVFHGSIGDVRIWAGKGIDPVALLASAMWRGVDGDRPETLRVQYPLHSLEAMPEELREAALEQGLLIDAVPAPPGRTRQVGPSIVIHPPVVVVPVPVVETVDHPSGSGRDALVVELELMRQVIESLEKALEEERRKVADREQLIEELKRLDEELGSDETTLDAFVRDMREKIESARRTIGDGAGNYRLGRVTIQAKVLPGAKGRSIRFPSPGEVDGALLTTIDLDFETTAVVESEPPKPRVPDVRGYTEPRARRELVGSGFAAEISYQAVATLAERERVVDQHPVPGSSGEPGSSVTIFIGKES